MLMAAVPGSVGALDLFQLALELVEAKNDQSNERLDCYVKELLAAAKNLLDSSLTSGAYEPDAIQLALMMSSNPELDSRLRAVHSLRDISPEAANAIRSKMGLEVAA